MSSSELRRARVMPAGAPASAEWLPAAWPAAAAVALGSGAAGSGGFMPGLVSVDGDDGSTVGPRVRGDDGVRDERRPQSVVPADAGSHRAPFLDALPDFGAPTTGRGGTAAAIRQACARAADAREAELRAEFEATWAAEADALAERAAAEADAAYAAGLAEGRAAGGADAEAALAGVAGALDAAAGEVRAHEARWLGDLEAHVAALAVAVARHVIGREVAGDDAFVTALVARAVAEFPADQPLAARVHPGDVAALKAAWAAAPRAAELRWVPDAGVMPGGALVEGRERIVDGRVDAALERVYRAISGQQA